MGRTRKDSAAPPHSQERLLRILRLAPGLPSREYARLLGARVDLVSSALCALRKKRKVYSVVSKTTDDGEGWPEWWPE